MLGLGITIRYHIIKKVLKSFISTFQQHQSGDAGAELLLPRLRHEGRPRLRAHLQVLFLLRQVLLHNLPLEQDPRPAGKHHPEVGLQRVRSGK